MLDRHDASALVALSDALADAASVHRSAARVADDPALAETMARREQKLDRLAIEVRQGRDGEPGSMLRVIDQVKLAVDRLWDDDDACADTASRESKRGLLKLIDDHLLDPELSDAARRIFLDVRDRIAGGELHATAPAGLRPLAT
ncbi:hypothetical protein TPR58_06165 [Sphingomonas sp. HF-S3]|uniref:Uncharacterized protein n=1 Tax=Sphingomonas rustica TaxID=3103142 RepID=A0ABV0B6X9_9SPHN